MLQAAVYCFHAPMPFRIGNTFLSDRHLKLAGYLSLYRSRYEKTGLLDLNLPDSPMTQQYRTGQELLRNGALDIAEVQILNWGAKYLELCDLEKFAPHVVRRFKRRLRTNRLDDYLGVQCELAVASMLVSKSFQFSCPDPPDFQINVNGSQEAFIECTSVHIGTDSDKDRLYKIGSAINNKQKKGYCNGNTALVIDVTNVMYKSDEGGWDLNPQAIKNRFFDRAANSGFGAVLIISETVTLDEMRFQTVYDRLSVKGPSPQLQTVLDQCFPEGIYF